MRFSPVSKAAGGVVPLMQSVADEASTVEVVRRAVHSVLLKVAGVVVENYFGGNFESVSDHVEESARRFP